MRETISVGRHHVVEPPAVRVADVHVLDEPQDQPLVACPARERQHRVLVHPAPDDRVDLDRREARPRARPRSRRAPWTTGKSTPFIDPKTSSSSESSETVIRCSPAVGERPGERPERGPVRREREVDRLAVGRPDRGQRRDEHRQVAPDERLAARDPQLPDAEPDEDAGQPLDLLERQHELLGQEREVAPEDLGRHAVRAAEVAAVGDRDPEVAQGTAEAVGHGRRPCRRNRSPRIRRRHGGRDAGTARPRPIVAPTPDAHAHRPHPAVPPECAAGTSSDSTAGHPAA